MNQADWWYFTIWGSIPRAVFDKRCLLSTADILHEKVNTSYSQTNCHGRETPGMLTNSQLRSENGFFFCGSVLSGNSVTSAFLGLHSLQWYQVSSNLYGNMMWLQTSPEVHKFYTNTGPVLKFRAPQKGDVCQIPYWGPPNIGRHLQKCSRPILCASLNITIECGD